VITPAHTEPPVDLLLDERYEVIETLSAGPSTSRYTARRRDTGARVILHLWSEELAADGAFVEAVRAHAALMSIVAGQCPGIAAVQDQGWTSQGRLFLAEEAVDGPTVAELVREHGPLAVERALRLAVAVAETLESAHSLGGVHGALNPDSVVVVGDESVKILGFGLARLAPSSPFPPGARFTMSPYQAPEEASGGAVTEQSDTYGVGGVLWYMLTGQPPLPLAAAWRRARLARVAHHGFRIPRPVQRVLLKALEPRLNKRYLGMSYLCNDLWAEVSPTAEQASHAGLVPPGWRPSLAVAGLAALCVAGGAAWLTLHGPAPTVAGGKDQAAPTATVAKPATVARPAATPVPTPPAAAAPSAAVPAPAPAPPPSASVATPRPDVDTPPAAAPQPVVAAPAVPQAPSALAPPEQPSLPPRPAPRTREAHVPTVAASRPAPSPAPVREVAGPQPAPVVPASVPPTTARTDAAGDPPRERPAVSAVPLPPPPVAAIPIGPGVPASASRDLSDDPHAIIDWLLGSGGRVQR
jgi:serine/threonine protein kinase